MSSPIILPPRTEFLTLQDPSLGWHDLCWGKKADRNINPVVACILSRFVNFAHILTFVYLCSQFFLPLRTFTFLILLKKKKKHKACRPVSGSYVIESPNIMWGRCRDKWDIAPALSDFEETDSWGGRKQTRKSIIQILGSLSSSGSQVGEFFLINEFIYISEAERQWCRGRHREKFSFCWFPFQMLLIARLGQDTARRQELNPGLLPGWQRFKVLEPWSAASHAVY